MDIQTKLGNYLNYVSPQTTSRAAQSSLNLESAPSNPSQPGEKVTISSEAIQLLKSDVQDETILTANSGGGTTLPPWPPQDNTPNSGGGTTLPPWPPQDKV